MYYQLTPKFLPQAQEFKKIMCQNSQNHHKIDKYYNLFYKTK